MQYHPPLGGAANDPYVDANPGAGIDGSVVPAAAVEQPQREIIAVLTAAGIAPDGALTNQLASAISELIQRQTGNYALDTGTPNHFVVALAGDAVVPPQDGQPVRIKAANAVTGASDLDVGSGAITLVRNDGTATQNGDIPAGSVFQAVYIAADNKWFLTSAPTFNANTLGQGAFKSVSDNTKASVASVAAATTAGHLATFADANGTVQDGGVAGTAAAKAASDNTKANVASVAGATTVDHLALFADAAGTVKDSGYTSRQLATAWVNWNGTGTVAIRDSFNVSSITDNGVGDYSINPSANFANANFCWTHGTAQVTGGNNNTLSENSRGVNFLRVINFSTNNGVAQDNSVNNVAFFGG